jgi:F0F1-type ATP synthase epsilon subunit
MAEKNSFELELIRTGSNKIFKVEWVEVQSPTGDFVVGPGHSPLVSTLKDRGKLKYKDFDSKNVTQVDTYGGIFKVQEDKAVAILDL